MRKFYMTLGAICLFLTLSGFPKMVLHDSTAAAALTTKFLRLDANGRYQQAYALCDKAFTDKVSLESFVKNNPLNKDPNLGRLKRAEFRYYMLVGTQDYIELIYDCDFEKLSGIPVHFILSGSASSGYKITVVDIGYNYKVYGKDEDKRPHLTMDGENAITF